MRINKLLLAFLFALCFSSLATKLSANELDSLVEVVLKNNVYEEEVNVDFSAIFFDLESRMPNKIKNANAYELYIIKGMELYNQGDYLAALSVFNNLSDHELYRNKDEEMLVNYYLGICFNRLGNLPIALYYLEKMIHEIEEHPISTEKRHQLYATYASMKLNDNKVDEAMQYFKKCQSILHAFGFGNAGTVLQKKGDTAASIPLLFKEVELLKEIGTNEGLLNCYMAIGKAFAHDNKTDSAINYFKKAINVAEETKNQAGKVKAFEAILGLKIAKKHFPEIRNIYNEYLKAQNEWQREIQINNRQSIQQLSKIVNMSRKSLTKKNEINTLSLEKERLVYFIISLCLLVVLLFVIIFYNANSRKKIQQKSTQLAEKNQALKDSFVTISKTNRQNELLLREVHHRVKNNLQMLISMFNLQKNSTTDEKLKGILNQAQDRLLSIALVHQNVYQTNDFEFIDLRIYIENLINSLDYNNSKEVSINQQIESIELNITKVIPIGLIICELVTNSLKHAKPENQELQISLSAIHKNETLIIAYNDNGLVEQEISLQKSENSIGITLIELFADQLDAKLSFNHLSSINGFHCRLEIPILISNQLLNKQ
ncbi:MAG: histidine kinase dimerization/phosphoacceptor domain -containing protein [Vicingaceae bacterium]